MRKTARKSSKDIDNREQKRYNKNKYKNKQQLFGFDSREENMQEILNWIQGHLPLTIAIAVAVVLLIVIVVALAVSSARGKKKNANSPNEQSAVKSEAVAADPETVDISDDKTTEKEGSETVSSEEYRISDEKDDTGRESVAEPSDEAVSTKEFTPVTEETSDNETSENVASESVASEVVAPENSEPKTETVTNRDESNEKPLAKKPAEKPVKSSAKPAVKIVGTAGKRKKAVEDDDEIFDGVEIGKKVGKWTVETRGGNEYVAKLTASNGEVMLASESYSTENGARSGIATIIKTVSNGKFVIYRDKNDNYYFKLKTAANRLICVGGIYKAKDQCERAVESVKRIAPAAVVYDTLVEGAKYEEYVPAKVNYVGSKGGKGKWKLETSTDGKFAAKLYASNGQLMLATEEVSQKKTVVNAIDAVKKNAAAGNFVIDRDKFGRYYYKLRNAQKSVICIGESYESLDSCVSAIESVRRYAATATVPAELKLLSYNSRYV